MFLQVFLFLCMDHEREGNSENMSTKIRTAIVGKVAIVTGASSGIGEVTALEFASAGAKVVLAARRIERLQKLAETIRAEGGCALPVQTDLTDIGQIRNLVQTTLATFGRIDVLANIAGKGYYDWFEELSSDNLREHYEVNVIGLAELTREVLPSMKDRRSGFILNMCSYSSVIAAPPLTVYASTKYAVEGLTDGLRRELIPWGIKVIRIHPSGVTGTEFKEKASRDGGIQFKSISLGQVSRERVARTLVRLIERPRRAVFLGRLYDGLAILNKLFPWVVDWASSTWVRIKQAEELKKGQKEEPPP
jgi:NADP-dependent 3-hydroxy acid dehydrogenase YdfG